MPRPSPGKSKSSAASGSLFPSPARESEKPSAVPALIAYIDGGARGNTGPAGFGAHIQDAAGKTFLSYNDPLWLAQRHGLGMPPAAEAMNTGRAETRSSTIPR